MTRLILSAALLALVAGCNGSSAPASAPASTASASSSGACALRSAPATQPTAAATPINKYCAVDRDDKVDPAVTYLYQGKVIGFCCEDCIPKFKADPEKYMKDLK